MGIHLKVIKRKKNIDYLFVDDVSEDHYQNALFRLTFKYDSLRKENIEMIDEYLNNSCTNLIEIINGYDTSSTNHGSHEGRIKSLEDEIATLTNALNSQTKIYGTLKIRPSTNDMDFNKDGTMLKFTNMDGGVYTTSILQNGVETQIVLPIGEYSVNVVNSLNDITDGIFWNIWNTATSEDNNHTMKYTVVEGETQIDAILEYENKINGV